MAEFCISCMSENLYDYIKIGIYRYKKCDACALVQLSPMPNSIELTRYYNSDYYHKKGYKDISKFNSQLYISDAKVKFQVLKRYTSKTKTNKILDYGCGIGNFLTYLKLQEFQNIYGFDINDDSKRSLEEKGIPFLTTETVSQMKFEIITLWDVAEHLNDPLATLKFLSSVMEENGVLIIGTTCIEDFFDNTLFGYTMWADPPAHTVLYSRKTLINLLSDAGFKNINITVRHGIGSNIALRNPLIVIKIIIKRILLHKKWQKSKMAYRAGSGTYLLATAIKHSR